MDLNSWQRWNHRIASETRVKWQPRVTSNMKRSQNTLQHGTELGGHICVQTPKKYEEIRKQSIIKAMCFSTLSVLLMYSLVLQCFWISLDCPWRLNLKIRSRTTAGVTPRVTIKLNSADLTWQLGINTFGLSTSKHVLPQVLKWPFMTYTVSKRIKGMSAIRTYFSSFFNIITYQVPSKSATKMLKSAVTISGRLICSPDSAAAISQTPKFVFVRLQTV